MPQPGGKGEQYDKRGKETRIQTNNTDVYYPECGMLELQSYNKALAVIFS